MNLWLWNEMNRLLFVDRIYTFLLTQKICSEKLAMNNIDQFSNSFSGQMEETILSTGVIFVVVVIVVVFQAHLSLHLKWIPSAKWMKILHTFVEMPRSFPTFRIPKLKIE